MGISLIFFIIAAILTFVIGSISNVFFGHCYDLMREMHILHIQFGEGENNE
jgi:hypothetical protein